MPTRDDVCARDGDLAGCVTVADGPGIGPPGIVIVADEPAADAIEVVDAKRTRSPGALDRAVVGADQTAVIGVGSAVGLLALDRT